MTNASGRVPPHPETRLTVPAGLFAPHRRPAFVLLDAIGDRATVDAHWLEDCPNEQVTLAHTDAPAFRAYLRTHLQDILATEAVPLADRAWAVHRALVHELAFLLAGAGDRRGSALLETCRGLASFLARHFEPDTLFRSLRPDAPHTPVVHGVETAIGAVALALADGERSVTALSMIGAAGAVADAGLLDLPRGVREKRAALTPMERKVIERHADLSVRRLQEYRLAAPAIQRAVAHHHERWDGDGYPARLAAEAIPREARYLAVADTYSTLTVARRGMPRLGRGDALREMARSAGQFDPGLLRLLVGLLTDAARRADADAA